MKNRLRSLITAVERLGLDTQPIRDLMSASNVDFTEYEARVANLEREASNHPPGSQPFQVEILLKHLNRPKEATYQGRNINITADSYIVQKHESNTDPTVLAALDKINTVMEKMAEQSQAPQPVSPQTSGVENEEVLKRLNEVNQKLDNIKIPEGSVAQIPTDPDAPQIEDLFVNPIDEEELKKISGEIKVAPKKGRSLSSSLKKLKKYNKK